MLGVIKLFFNEKIYPLEAFYATSLAYLDNFYVYLDKKNKKIEINLEIKNGRVFNKEKIAGEFKNNLIQNALRLNISKDNLSYRELIVNQAIFASLPSKIRTSMNKSNSNLDDPLGIAIPWEDKFKKKKKK